MTSPDKSYIVVRPQITGSIEDWEMVYLTDGRRAATPRGAFGHGLRDLGHDDFWVCEMEDDELQRILHSDLEQRPQDDEEFAQVKEALR